MTTPLNDLRKVTTCCRLSHLLPPSWAALGALCMTPVIALLFLLMAGLLLLAWPFIPVLVYLQRRSEMATPTPTTDHDP